MSYIIGFKSSNPNILISKSIFGSIGTLIPKGIFVLTGVLISKGIFGPMCILIPYGIVGPIGVLIPKGIFALTGVLIPKGMSNPKGKWTQRVFFEKNPTLCWSNTFSETKIENEKASGL